MSIRKVHIIDYGVGNLFSVSSAIKKIGCEPVITKNPNDLQCADFLILPGVGAFQKGMKNLIESGFKDDILRHAEQERPILGICLGMQMLFDCSDENGQTSGLGLIPGHVKKITTNKNIKVPHIGWSALKSVNGILRGEIENKFMYFVHSYHPITEEQYCTAKVDYHGIGLTAMVNKDNIFACQFHPEKSAEDGLNLLKKIILCR
jgi:glutamine amidotransferase